MIDTSHFLERFLQKKRFKKAQEHLSGDVLDFGGNAGELSPWVKGVYTCVNYDHSKMAGKRFDTIVSLAVIEHIAVDDVYIVFSKFKKQLNPGGKIFLTTPTPLSKPLLELFASIGFLEKDNINEHKHYWNKADLMKLAEKTGFSITRYGKFQLGMNQFALMKHLN